MHFCKNSPQPRNEWRVNSSVDSACGAFHLLKPSCGFAVVVAAMASASDTHHTLRDHDGFIEELYHLLWVKNINGEPCPDVLVPDVVIYKYRIPAYWYFTGSDGQLKRKNKGSIINKKIFAEFTKGAKSPSDVVAYHISENEDASPGQPSTTIQYFDTRTLHEFLFHKDKHNDGCLQKFIKPKGDSNSMIQAAWSPQICLLERRVNLQRLDATRVPLQQRCCTYEGGEHLSKITPVRGTLLPDKIQQLCWGIVSHVRTTSHEHQHISRLLLNFKCDDNDQVWLLWCSSVRLSQPEPPPGESPSPSSAMANAQPLGLHQQHHHHHREPVCLQVPMHTPDRHPQRADGKAICPYSESALDGAQEYNLTFKTIIEHSNRLAALEGQPDAFKYRVPPLLLRVCPDLTTARYAAERSNPMFLFRSVLVSEDAYLEFTAGSTPGYYDAGAGSDPLRNSLVSSGLSAASGGKGLGASTSTPTLPKMRIGHLT